MSRRGGSGLGAASGLVLTYTLGHAEIRAATMPHTFSVGTFGQRFMVLGYQLQGGAFTITGGHHMTFTSATLDPSGTPVLFSGLPEVVGNGDGFLLNASCPPFVVDAGNPVLSVPMTVTGGNTVTGGDLVLTVYGVAL